MNKIELCNFDVCTQCFACQTACPKECISMVGAEGGFVIPEIDREKCVECGACMKACHKITPQFTYEKPIKTYACWTKNIADRERSSSGGAFTVIARKIIEDGGVVYGASMCEDLRCRHLGVEKVEEIAFLQGSKYVQSYLGETYKQVRKELLNDRKVLFTGTPCQVAGLYSYLHKTYEKLYTIDVVCHGIPSQNAFDAYIYKIGLTGKCKNFYFRFTKGWGFQLSMQLISSNHGISNRRLISPRKSYYLRAFTAGLMFSEACYSCPYARPERVSDITLADYWGLGDKTPFNHPTFKGVSCLLVNNEKALALMNKCLDLEYEERPFEEAVEGNHNLSNVSGRPSGRDTYYEDSLNMPIDALSLKYGIQAHLRDYLRLLKQKINSYR